MEEEFLNIPKDKFEEYMKLSEQAVNDKYKFKKECEEKSKTIIKLRNDLQYKQNELELSTARIDKLEEELENARSNIQPYDMGKCLSIFQEIQDIKKPEKGKENETNNFIQTRQSWYSYKSYRSNSRFSNVK